MLVDLYLQNKLLYTQPVFRPKTTISIVIYQFFSILKYSKYKYIFMTIKKHNLY